MSKGIKTNVKLAGTFAAVLGVISAPPLIYYGFNPPEKGVEYLEGRGYSNIEQVGRISYFNSCVGEGVFSREYKATNPEGENVQATVCFRPFLGPHLSLFSES